ncbi:copper amine oxidase [Roseicyclus sp.]|uniref:copper amine oxidase n=1 Tax=Roseicyclus sp. TaxID=1914329 RepID=UPI003F6A1780
MQPEGVSFTLDGHLLKWHDWELRIGFKAREATTSPLRVLSIMSRRRGRRRAS